MSVNSQYFINLINERGYKRGLEIGVRDGISGSAFMKTNIEHMYGIDHLEWQSGRKLEAESNGRYQYVIGRSPDCAEAFESEVFDVIFLDGDHSYEGVKRDLNAWWPKLKSGGLFCGDDYHHASNFMSPGNTDEGQYGVVEAVEEFAEVIIKNKVLPVKLLYYECFVSSENDKLRIAANWNTDPLYRYIADLEAKKRGVYPTPPTWMIYK